MNKNNIWFIADLHIGHKNILFHQPNRIEPMSLKDDKDKPLSDKEIQDTVVHEVIHAILDTLCFFDVSNNEPVVEWLTKCLIQLEKQDIFKI